MGRTLLWSVCRLGAGASIDPRRLRPGAVVRRRLNRKYKLCSRSSDDAYGRGLAGARVLTRWPVAVRGRACDRSLAAAERRIRDRSAAYGVAHHGAWSRRCLTVRVPSPVPRRGGGSAQRCASRTHASPGSRPSPAPNMQDALIDRNLWLPPTRNSCRSPPHLGDGRTPASVDPGRRHADRTPMPSCSPAPG